MKYLKEKIRKSRITFAFEIVAENVMMLKNMNIFCTSVLVFSEIFSSYDSRPRVPSEIQVRDRFSVMSLEVLLISYTLIINHRLLMESSSLLADWYFENSQPVTAACCHLAVNDITVSSLLLRSGIGTITSSV